jgi:hypothetical protein
MKLFMKLFKAHPIRVQGSDMLLLLAVGTEFEGRGDQVEDDCGLRESFGEEMLDVAAALSAAGEGCATAQETGVAVVEESGEETAAIRR